jgi:hypothetical protein
MCPVNESCAAATWLVDMALLGFLLRLVMWNLVGPVAISTTLMVLLMCKDDCSTMWNMTLGDTAGTC